MDNEQVKSHKTGTIVTYVIVLVALLAGFFIPMSFSFEEATNSMLAWQIPKMLNAALGGGIEALDISSDFTLSYLFASTEFDIGAWLASLYALFTVVALFFLIPVLAGKRTKRTSLNSAFVIELLAMTALALLCIIDITKYMNGAVDDIAYMLLIALGVVVIMAFIQRTMADGGSGVVKFILVILSMAAVLCALFPLEVLIPSLEGNLSVGGMGPAVLGDAALSETLAALMTGALVTEGTMGILNIFLAILGIMVILNLVLDIWGLCKKPNMFMHVCNQIRYLIELVAEIVVIIMAYVVDDPANGGMGFMLVVLTCLTAIRYIIDLVRIIMHSHKKSVPLEVAEYQYYSETVEMSEQKKERKDREKAEKRAKAERDEQARRDQIAQFEAERQAQKAAKENAKAEKEAAKRNKKNKHQALQNAPVATNEPSSNDGYASAVEEEKVVYNGPTDDFIDKLTDEEKMEFWTVFLKREEGALSTIPEYRLGENNTKFFTTAVIYYSKLRGLVSDGLMDKIYEENKFI